MFSTIIKLCFVYIVVLILAFFLRKTTYDVMNKAIENKKLSTGPFFTFFPVEGEEAVKLAKGYKRGINLVVWFLVFFFSYIFISSYFYGAFDNLP